MTFKLLTSSDKLVFEMYSNAMNELQYFFDFVWNKNRPRVFLVKNRKAINERIGRKTKRWVVGWSEGFDIYVLDRNYFEKESCHTYSDRKYYALIKHELAHVFTQKMCEPLEFIEPNWLWEGIAMYVTGEYLLRDKPLPFTSFIDYYSKDNFSGDIYEESGYAVAFLVEKYGKQKLFDLLRKLKQIKNKEEFDNLFVKVYKITLEYKNFI